MNDTIKVLVVDDEKLFRDYLLKVLGQNEEGFFCCGEAKNGRDALEAARLMRPDVILADINMPHMDGLEFSRRIKEEEPLMEVALLTGFSEFEYARTAVQIGVSEYLLKPFTEEELMQCLRKMKKKILEQREQNRQSRQNSLFAVSQFLRELTDGECAHPERAQKVLQEYDVTFDIGKDSVAVLLQLEDPLKYWVDFQDKHTAKFCVSNILGEVMGASYSHAVFNAGANRLGILINVEKAGLSGLQTQLEEICRLCRKLLKCRMAFSVSEIGSGIAQIHNNWVSVQGNSFHKEKETFLNETDMGYYKKLLKTDSGRVSKARQLVVDSVEYMMENYPDPELSIEVIAGKMYVSSSYLRKAFQSLTERTVMGVLLDIRMNQAACRIIRGDMRISDIAQAVGYRNPAHFSRTFKKQFGQTPVEYELQHRKK